MKKSTNFIIAYGGEGVATKIAETLNMCQISPLRALGKTLSSINVVID
jgi:hypothetical protein